MLIVMMLHITSKYLQSPNCVRAPMLIVMMLRIISEYLGNPTCVRGPLGDMKCSSNKQTASAQSQVLIPSQPPKF